MREDRHAREDAARQERAWLEAYRAGDIDALGQLVELYRKPLYAFILRMTGSRHEADDIFQDVWFRAIRHMKLYRQKSFISWLFRIAHNVIVDRARRRQVQNVAEIPSHEAEKEERPIESLADPQPGPDQIAIGRETADRIAAAVAVLPPEQREVFWLRMEGDMPFKEIAALQNVSINTALARMQYALEKVCAALAKEQEVS
jgi:RNA polymerase sigma-70 factor (ECF subfamily)